MRILLASMAAALVTFALVPAASADPAADVKTAYAAWDEAFNKGDAKAVAAFYTDDAVFLPATHDVIKGPSGVENFFAALFTARRASNLNAASDRLLEGAMPVRPSGPPRTLLDYLTELARADDGEERIDRCDFGDEEIGHLYEARHWIQDQLVSFQTDFKQRNRLAKLLGKLLAGIHLQTDSLKAGNTTGDFWTPAD